ncbi:MAG: response regulator [Thermoguttaceae bacterium]
MKTILFADDNKSIRKYCQASFEDEGYRVVLARDGVEALKAYRTECPDLAILDLSMPRVGGMEALERIKKMAPDFPVILFTANDDDCLRDPRATLAVACVEKSNDLSDLKGIVASTLRWSRSESGEAPLRLGLPPLRKEVGCS